MICEAHAASAGTVRRQVAGGLDSTCRAQSWKMCITSLTAEAAGAFLLLFAEFRVILLLKGAQTIQWESRRLGGDTEFSEPPG